MDPEQLGKASHHVAKNLRILRMDQDLSLRQLEARLADMGYKIPFAAIGNIETGKRGIDVDEVFALAEALQVGVGALLFEPIHPYTPHDVEIHSPDGETSLVEANRWQLRQHHVGEWPLWVEKPATRPDEIRILAEYMTRMDPVARSEFFDKEGNRANGRAHYAMNFLEIIDLRLRRIERLLRKIQNSWNSYAAEIRSGKSSLEDERTRENVARIWTRLRDEIAVVASTTRASDVYLLQKSQIESASAIEVDALNLLTDIAADCQIRTLEKEGQRESCFRDGEPLSKYITAPLYEDSENPGITPTYEGPEASMITRKPYDPLRLAGIAFN